MTREDHDRAVRYIAANRFPFPDQTDWPDDYVTITNESEEHRGIPTANGTHYPDIIIVDGSDEIREVGEVETEVSADHVYHWRLGSEASDNKTTTGVKHFFVYVPPGQEKHAEQLLIDNEISYSGVRTWSIDEQEAVVIQPVTTKGDMKDHR
jgi:hypothetical protein